MFCRLTIKIIMQITIFEGSINYKEKKTSKIQK
jgi:hypothetical protein